MTNQPTARNDDKLCAPGWKKKPIGFFWATPYATPPRKVHPWVTPTVGLPAEGQVSLPIQIRSHSKIIPQTTKYPWEQCSLLCPESSLPQLPVQGNLQTWLWSCAPLKPIFLDIEGWVSLCQGILNSIWLCSSPVFISILSLVWGPYIPWFSTITHRCHVV